MDIYNMTLNQLENYFEQIGEKKFKATQIFDWLYKKRINSFDEMKNIKKETIEKLKQDFTIELPKLVLKQSGKDVNKYLFSLKDNSKVEAALMFHDYGISLCLSTQVGCNMGCSFCESGRKAKLRNLETGEIVSQILFIENDIKKRVSHIVLMGIGEPFDNYDNVMNFIKIINNPKGIDIGSRHITVSTCGIVPKINEFAKEKLQVNLALSLHAPNDTLRSELMKINKVYGLNKVIEAIKNYIKITNRRVTIEYILLDKINDTEKCALQLCKLLKGLNVYVNLIPYNETSNNSFKKSKNVMKFYDILKKNKMQVTVRKEFGSEITAACGQLRSNYEEE